MKTRKAFVCSLPAACSVLWLTACGGGSSASQGPPAPPTVAASMMALVASGVLPTLDVTTSITGTDANNNGVRDDLDTLIAGQTDTPSQKAALTQAAQSIQATLTLNTGDASAVATAATGMRKSIACLYAQYDAATAGGRFHWIQEMSINTMPRLKAYDAFNIAMNNSVTHLEQGAVCNA
jgi:hypothetical protein